MTRQTDSAESTMNSAPSFAADPVTTNTFPQAADAVAFCTTPASRWASCRSHNQNIQAARCDANGARRDRTDQGCDCEIASNPDPAQIGNRGIIRGSAEIRAWR